MRHTTHRDTLPSVTETQEIARVHERISLARFHGHACTTVEIHPSHRWEIEALYKRLGYTVRSSKWCPEQTEIKLS